MARKKVLTEEGEIKRLSVLFDALADNKKSLAQGLIAQAARLRVRLDQLNADIQENGLTELFQQSEKVDPYTRERPEAALFVKLDKNYQAIMRQLTDLLPDSAPAAGDDLDEFRHG